MGLLNEEAFFERHGEGYVVRLTPFSAGYVISEAQKDALFAALKRIDGHTSIEAVLAVTLIVTLFLTGLLRSETPGPWIIALSIPALAALTMWSLRQRSRLIRRALGDRPPDLPRPPFWSALWKPRPPLVAARFAILILRCTLGLLILLLAGGNALAVILMIVVADAPAQQASAEEILSLTFWIALLLFNVVLGAMIAALGFEARRLRRRQQGA